MKCKMVVTLFNRAIISIALSPLSGDTMLKIPVQKDRDDEAVLRKVAHDVAEIYTSADDLLGKERADFIKTKLRAYEGSWN